MRAVRGGGPWVVLLAVAAVAGAAGEVVLPAALGRAVDAVLSPSAPTLPWTAPLPSLAAWVALSALVIACDALRQVASGASTAGATAWLRGLLLRHVMAVGPPATRRFPTGDVVSRLVGGTSAAGDGPAAVVMAAAAVIPVAGAPIALALIDPWLAVTFLAGLPAVLLVLRSFVRDTTDVVARYQRAQGLIAARLLDAIGGARTIAAAGTVERESARVLGPLEELRASGHATWRTLGRAVAQGSLLVPLLRVLVLGAGGVELAAGRITPGELLAASQYAVLGAGVGAVIPYLNRLARARAGAQRADELLALASMPYGADLLPATGSGRLELRGVTLRAGDEAVIDGLDLVVPAGSAVAVVGRSGSGKSLLAALSGRLLDPDGGDVLLDGVPLRRLARRELRSAVQYAFERPALLGRTVRDAIAFGAWTPSRRQIEAAAGAACADAFVLRLPGGYETLVSEAPLSGGEVQRLGLARAFAHAETARLLVLDDATSSLDTATEVQVSRVLTEGAERRTRLIVAHRAATAARADLVAWLDGGRLRAFGTHDELWGDPAYRAAFAAGAPET